MRAAIQLVEKQGATVVGQAAKSPLMLWLIKSSGADFGHMFLFAAGVAAVAIENTEGGKWIKENYKFSHCIPEELQSQVDGKYMNILKSFNK